MNARCIGCSTHIAFKAARGGKLDGRRCTCGQRYERMTFVRYERTRAGDVQIHRTYNHIYYLYDQPNERYLPQPVIPNATSL